MLTAVRRVLVFVIVAVIAVLFPASAYGNWSFVCLTDGECSYILASEGTRPAVTDAEYMPPASSGVPDPCMYRQLSPPPPEDVAWGGNDPAHGRLWYSLCPDDFADSSWDGSGNRIVHYAAGDPYYVADGDTPDGASAGLNPMALVARARGAFELPAPAPVFGPDAGTIAVKIPVWLSTQPFDPVVQTASAGRFTAEVSAELAETVWQMGEPVDPATLSLSVPPVVCTGTGAVFAAGMNPGAPPCGYTYIWRSLPERTGGTGVWPVTVTSRYTISWTVTGGAGGAVIESGNDSVETTTTAPLLVREWHSVLIDHLPN